jgi:hypothetical protein
MNIGAAKLPAVLALIKSAGDPLVDVGGAYFPAWLACMIAGSVGTWLLGEFLSRIGLAAVLRPSAIMYPSLFAALTGGAWLIFFSAR